VRDKNAGNSQKENSKKEKSNESWAVIEVGGSQQILSVGDEITVNKVNVDKGKTFSVDKVLMLVEGGKVNIGTPYLEGRCAEFEVLDHKKGKKITVIKFRAKARYRRKKGHRQALSVLKLKKILVSKK